MGTVVTCPASLGRLVTNPPAQRQDRTARSTGRGEDMRDREPPAARRDEMRGTRAPACDWHQQGRIIDMAGGLPAATVDSARADNSSRARDTTILESPAFTWCLPVRRPLSLLSTLLVIYCLLSCFCFILTFVVFCLK